MENVSYIHTTLKKSYESSCTMAKKHNKHTSSLQCASNRNYLKYNNKHTCGFQNEATVIVNDLTFSTPHISRIDDMSDRNHAAPRLPSIPPPPPPPSHSPRAHCSVDKQCYGVITPNRTTHNYNSVVQCCAVLCNNSYLQYTGII